MIPGSIRFRDVSLTGGACRTGLLALVVLAVAGAGGEAQAMQLTPVQKQEMKLHYERATRAYDVQKYGEAVEEYQKAYEIGGDPAMLYNVAQSYRLNDQLPDALRFYRRYLQRSPNARNREDVERKIADLEKTVEDRRKAAAAAAAATSQSPSNPVVIAPPPAPPPDAESSGGGGKRIAGIVLAVVGGAALVTAGITAKMAGDKGNELTQASMKGGTVVFDPSIESSGKTLDKVALISAIAGGAIAVTGVVLILTSGGHGQAQAEEQRAFLAPVVGAGVIGGTAVVRF